MIKEFKNNNIRPTGVIYSGIFEAIKELYVDRPDDAGELAISAIELILTGEISSDNSLVKVALATIKPVVQNDVDKYNAKIQQVKDKKISDQKLDVIADLMNKGTKQAQIGKMLGLTQQTVSNRVKVIREKYPELLQVKNEILQVNDQNTSILQENKIVQNCTSTENLVQTCKEKSLQKNKEKPFQLEEIQGFIF